MHADPRCHDHRDRPTLPACPTCHRIRLEADIVTRVVDALIGAGFALATDAESSNSERFYGPVTPTTDRAAILAALQEVDEEFLGVFPAAAATGATRVCQPSAWVRFVYGNDGWDVISDYSTRLEETLSPVMAYIDTIEP